jgi:hypothetical protein
VRQPPGGQDLDSNTRARNALQRSLRCLGERGFALLTGRWRALRHVTASPGKIGDIARAALALTHSGHGYITQKPPDHLGESDAGGKMVTCLAKVRS